MDEEENEDGLDYVDHDNTVVTAVGGRKSKKKKMAANSKATPTKMNIELLLGNLERLKPNKNAQQTNSEKIYDNYFQDDVIVNNDHVIDHDDHVTSSDDHVIDSDDDEIKGEDGVMKTRNEKSNETRKEKDDVIHSHPIFRNASVENTNTQVLVVRPPSAAVTTGPKYIRRRFRKVKPTYVTAEDGSVYQCTNCGNELFFTENKDAGKVQQSVEGDEIEAVLASRGSMKDEVKNNSISGRLDQTPRSNWTPRSNGRSQSMSCLPSGVTDQAAQQPTERRRSRSICERRKDLRSGDYDWSCSKETKIKKWLSKKNKLARKQRAEEKRLEKMKKREEEAVRLEEEKKKMSSFQQVSKWMKGKKNEEKLLKQRENMKKYEIGKKNLNSQLKEAKNVQNNAVNWNKGATDTSAQDRVGAFLPLPDSPACADSKNVHSAAAESSVAHPTAVGFSVVHPSAVDSSVDPTSADVIFESELKNKKGKIRRMRQSRTVDPEVERERRMKRNKEKRLENLRKKLSYEGWRKQKEEEDKKRADEIRTRKRIENEKAETLKQEEIVAKMEAKKRLREKMLNRKRVDSGVSKPNGEFPNLDGSETAPDNSSETKTSEGASRERLGKSVVSREEINVNPYVIGGMRISPERSRAKSPKPRVASQATKKVKYQVKSWDKFSSFVWDAVNEDEGGDMVRADDGRPKTIGSEKSTMDLSENIKFEPLDPEASTTTANTRINRVVAESSVDPDRERTVGTIVQKQDAGTTERVGGSDQVGKTEQEQCGGQVYRVESVHDEDEGPVQTVDDENHEGPVQTADNEKREGPVQTADNEKHAYHVQTVDRTKEGSVLPTFEHTQEEGLPPTTVVDKKEDSRLPARDQEQCAELVDTERAEVKLLSCKGKYSLSALNNDDFEILEKEAEIVEEEAETVEEDIAEFNDNNDDDDDTGVLKDNTEINNETTNILSSSLERSKLELDEGTSDSRHVPTVSSTHDSMKTMKKSFSDSRSRRKEDILTIIDSDEESESELT